LRARVRFLLSIDRRHLPPQAKGTTHRSILMDGNEFEFSEGFTDLHTAVYQDILGGGGFGLDDARPSIELTHRMKGAPVKRGAPADEHPMLASLG
jgi:UDP-N-acetyl-2-amino-2-deoxyglucuronate dehydrogenase